MYLSSKITTVFAIVAFSIYGFSLTAEAETFTKPYTFTDGTPAMASEVNENFDLLYSILNVIGNIVAVDGTNVTIGTMNPGTPSIFEVVSEEAGAMSMVTSYDATGSIIPVFMGRKARGTLDTPAAVQSGDILTHFGAKGHDGVNWQGGTTAGISFVASENYSPTNRGSKIVFLNTPNNSTTRQVRAVIDQNGYFGIGTGTPQSTLQVDGYTQLALTTGAPPVADCDESSEYGRMKVDATGGSLYICVASGWVFK